MSDQPPQDPPANPQPDGPEGPGKPADQPRVQQFNHSSVAARVPERLARGVFSTGQLVLDSPKEFVIDFFQGLTRPYAVVARVVLAPSTMGEFATALKENVDNYSRAFGPPPPLPTPQQQNRPTIQEIYENFKLPEELMSGHYANSVLIGHSPSEFFLDFITGFFPTSSVSSRIFLPAAQIPRFLNTVTTAIQNYHARYQPKPPPPAE